MIKKVLENNIIEQFIKYFGVAIVAFIVNYLSLYLFADIFNINYIISNVISFIFGLNVNYVLSKKYVFK